jgi:glyoxylase-like metal-dependent hydrolase (beta-lactamase superfamily II)
VWKAPHTLEADTLAQNPKKATFVTVKEKYVLSDGDHTIEIHTIEGSTHAEGIVMAYLPKEKILVEADVFNPPAPNAPVSTAPPAATIVNFSENLQRLKLDVDKIVPIHGRVVTIADLQKALGPSSTK